MSDNPSSGKKNCPFCGEEIISSAIFCRFCNHDLSVKSNSPSIIFKILPIILSILLLAVIGSSAFIIFNEERAKTQSQDNIFQQSTEIFNAQSTISGVSTVVATQELGYSKINNAYATEVVNYNNVQATRSVLLVQLTTLEKYKCDSTNIKFDYSNNSTISNSLKQYLGDRDGTITSATWEVVWNNSRTAIHKLTGKYLWVFIVYFNEPDYGYKNMIFDISDTCFLS